MEKICYGVEVEPALLPVGNRKLPPGSNVKDGARSDIVARGFWTPLDKAYFDIRVLHPGAKSNENKSFDKMYNQHEEEKKRQYNSRIQDIEHGTFTPLVFSTSGGMSKECNKFMKKLSEGLSSETQQAYSDTICYQLCKEKTKNGTFEDHPYLHQRTPRKVLPETNRPR